MGASNNESNVEVDALRPLRMDERMSWTSMAFVQAGCCVCVPSFLLGAILAESMNVTSAIVSGSIGYVIVVIVMAILGMQGSDLGVATCTTCQSAMGVKGARYIVASVFVLNLIGWFGINNAVCGEAFSNVVLDMTGVNIPVSISSCIWGVIMLTTAVFGMKAIEKLDKIAIPLLMVIMALGTYLAIHQYGIQELNASVDATMSFAAGIGLSFNFYAIGVIASSDFTRYQKTRKDVCKSTFWGVLPMGIFTLVLGVIMTKIANEYDISMVLINVGIPVLGVTSMILATWTTNSLNAYTGALSGTMVFNIPDNRRREVTAVVGIIGTILGAFGVLDHVEGILSMMACIACPVGGILIADYWIIGKGKTENWHAVKGFNWAGVISWFVGAVVAYVMYVEYYGIIIGLVLYLILERIMPSPSRGNGVALDKIDYEKEDTVFRA